MKRKDTAETDARGGTRLAAAVFCALALAASAAEPQPAKRASFEQVPKQALVELKATVGKPFSAGLVFIDGKFIPPPYKVERYGTAFRINGRQVTGQVIRWDEFLRTQAGARVETSAPAQTDAAAPAPLEPPEEPAAAEASADDLDDLFSDTPSPKKKPAARPAPRKPAAAPAPAPKTTVVFDGQFRPNDRTRAMVAKLNKIRTDIEVALRKGGSCFFGTRYSAVTADKAPTDTFLEQMPAVMKNAPSFEAFSSSARAKGVTYLSEAVLRDIYRNRLDYIHLQERARKVKEERKWESVLNGIR